MQKGVFYCRLMPAKKVIRIKSDDALFRVSFSKPVLAAHLVRSLLNPDIARLLDWKSLKVESVPGISGGLRENRADLVYCVRFLKQAVELRLFIALEHQSRPDRWAVYRLLEYEMLIWKQWRSQKPSNKHLPVIVPIIVYIGQAPWNAPRKLIELMGAPELVLEKLKGILPEAGYLLADLSPRVHGELPENPLCWAILRVMQSAKAGRLEEETAGIFKELAEHPKTEEYRQTMSHLYEYVFCQSELKRGELYDRFISQLPEEHKGKFMSTADMLIREGRKEGRKEGRQEGRLLTLQESVIEALEIKVGRKVPEGLREAVSAIRSETRLHGLLKAAIQADSFDGFSESL